MSGGGALPSQPSQPPLPPWADAALVAQALGVDASRVAGVESTPMTAPGENYASCLHRLRVRLRAPDGSDDHAAEEEDRWLVLKREADDPHVRQNTRDALFFSKEAECLARVVPAIQALLDKAAPGRYPPLGPRCLLHSAAPPSAFLLLEDLSLQGFRMADGRRGLGLRHALRALQALARFHGGSAVLLARDPSLARALPTPWKTADTDAFNRAITLTFRLAGEAALHWPECPDDHARLLLEITPKVYDRFAYLSLPSPKFNVINHADFWTNNILYRYQDGFPVEARIIDYQIVHVGSPAVDLLRFLYTSLREDVLDQYLDLLVRHYHASLEDVMGHFETPCPTLKELWDDIDEHGHYALFGVIVGIPFARVEKNMAPDLGKVMSDQGGLDKEVFNLPRFRKWLSRQLVDFGKRGWLYWNETCGIP